MSTCRSCGARIRWATTITSGRRMPVDADPVPDGNLLLDERPGQDPIVSVIPAGLTPIDDPPRYLSHFVTCPNADQHRKDHRHA